MEQHSLKRCHIFLDILIINPSLQIFHFQSNGLTTAVYMSRWYEYDIKSRKALIILMERSKKPIVITVGKVVELSLATFTLV
jgi:hypothetical protein